MDRSPQGSVLTDNRVELATTSDTYLVGAERGQTDARSGVVLAETGVLYTATDGAAPLETVPLPHVLNAKVGWASARCSANSTPHAPRLARPF